jgi:hypothetical protein
MVAVRHPHLTIKPHYQKRVLLLKKGYRADVAPLFVSHRGAPLLSIQRATLV